MESTISKPRKCPKCNEHKQGDKFYNYLSFYCIPCANEFSRDRRQKIKAGEIYIIKKVKNLKWFRYLDSKGVKYCGTCENVKPKDQFGQDIRCVTSGKKSRCKRCISRDRYQKIDQAKEDRHNKFLNSEWYKNYLERPGKKSVSPNVKKIMENRYKQMKYEKRSKFKTLPKYQ